MPVSANYQKILFSPSHSATEFTISSLHFASCKQKAAGKEILTHTDAAPVQLQKYSKKLLHSLLTCCI